MAKLLFKEILKLKSWTGQVAQWVEALPTKPDSLSSIPGAHVPGEK